MGRGEGGGDWVLGRGEGARGEGSRLGGVEVKAGVGVRRRFFGATVLFAPGEGEGAIRSLRSA